MPLTGVPHMFRGIYAAGSALDAAAQAQEATSENLAHLNTPGYRARGTTFETFDIALGRAVAPGGDYVGTRLNGVYHDFRAGAMQRTDAPLDLAIADPGQFFTVRGPDGQQLLSRNGDFRMNQQGLIVTQAGYPLLNDTGGTITIPPNTARVHIAGDGSVTADNAPVGRVRLVRVADPTKLTAVGPTLYQPPDDVAVTPVEGRMLQGFREGSNVDPAGAMVRMIIANRYYEAAQRALRTIAESVQLNTRPTT